MCGNSLDLETGEIDPRWENTRPVVATYKMGQIMQMKLSVRFCCYLIIKKKKINELNYFRMLDILVTPD